jgi:hypothetical protein
VNLERPGHAIAVEEEDEVHVVEGVLVERERAAVIGEVQWDRERPLERWPGRLPWR